MMSKKGLDNIGKALMVSVRDESITDIRMIISGQMKGEHAEKTRDRLKCLNQKQSEALSAVIPDFVDRVIHNTMTLLEQNEQLELVVTEDQMETKSSEESDGLAGELYGKRGWISRFSKES